MKSRCEVAKKPGPAQTTATHHDAIAAGLVNHSKSVVRAPNVAISQNWGVRDGFFKSGDSAPVCGAGVELGRGAGVQSDARDTGTLCRLGRLNVGQVVGVDALAHLDGQRDRPRCLHSALDNVAKQFTLPRQRGSPAFASDFRHRAAEVEIDVVGPILGHQHGHRLGNGLRVNAVQLNAPD